MKCNKSELKYWTENHFVTSCKDCDFRQAPRGAMLWHRRRPVTLSTCGKTGKNIYRAMKRNGFRQNCPLDDWCRADS